jgi:hypothetical protein
MEELNNLVLLAYLKIILEQMRYSKASLKSLSKKLQSSRIFNVKISWTFKWADMMNIEKQLTIKS